MGKLFDQLYESINDDNLNEIDILGGDTTMSEQNEQQQQRQWLSTEIEKLKAKQEALEQAQQQAEGLAKSLFAQAVRVAGQIELCQAELSKLETQKKEVETV